jgi:pimeloyl-ACP methyl ester carboxylesterase
MTTYVTSADGTRIAFDRLGDGPPVVVIGGMFCTRAATAPLAGALAERFTVFNLDRRGRGDSGDTPTYAVAREVEDVAAVVEAARPAGAEGAGVAVYGHSSGAALALETAAAGVPIARLVLHEPPYGGDDEESVQGARELARSVAAALAEDRRADAIAVFMTASGLPPEVAEGTAQDPQMQAVAPTMPYDFAVVGDEERGGRIPEDLVRTLAMPTLVVAGSTSPAFFRDTASRLVELLPDGRLTIIEGHGHEAGGDVVAPVVAPFLAGRAPTG